jgi:hypothetical protein
MLRLLFVILVITTPSVAAAQAWLIGDLPRKDESRPLETLQGLETEYGSIRTTEGIRLRTIMTRPAGASGELPAIFHTQAVSCGSLELPEGRDTTLGELAKRSGLVLIRVERSGTGDSEGQACSELDYDTEVRHYREAFDQTVRHPWVDASQVFIYGSSLGSTTAPLVARGKRVAGIFVQGGGAKTYLERMIDFDRLFLERSGKYSRDQVHEQMLNRIAFHHLSAGAENSRASGCRTTRSCARMAADSWRRRSSTPLWPTLCLALAGSAEELSGRMVRHRCARVCRLCRIRPVRAAAVAPGNRRHREPDAARIGSFPHP